MPELPETETIARDLDRAVAGAVISGVTVPRPDVLRGITPRMLARRLAGVEIRGTSRRAKAVVIALGTDDRLVVQPRFTGALLIDDGALPERERQFITVAFALTDGRSLAYRDIRRLGTVALMSPPEFAELDARLGVEPLDQAFTATH